MKKALKEALDKLDHTNDAHWTENGAPAVAAVNELAAGDEKFTREDITKGAPKLTRESLAAAATGEDSTQGGQGDDASGTDGLQDLKNPPEDGETDTTPPADQLADPSAPNDGFIDSPAQDEMNKDANGQPMTARVADVANAKTVPPAVIKEERKGEATTPLEQARKVGSNRQTFDHEAHAAEIKKGEDNLNAMKKQHAELGAKINEQNIKLDTMYTQREKFADMPSHTKAVQEYHASVYGKKA